MRNVRTSPHSHIFFTGAPDPIWWDATDETFLVRRSNARNNANILINAIPADEVFLQVGSEQTLIAGYKDRDNFFGLQVHFTETFFGVTRAERWMNEFETPLYSFDSFPAGFTEPPMLYPILSFQNVVGDRYAVSQWTTLRLFQRKNGSDTELNRLEIPGDQGNIYHPRLSVVHDPAAATKLMACVTFVSRQDRNYSGYAHSFFLEATISRNDCGLFCGIVDRLQTA